MNTIADFLKTPIIIEEGGNKRPDKPLKGQGKKTFEAYFRHRKVSKNTVDTVFVIKHNGEGICAYHVESHINPKGIPKGHIWEQRVKNRREVVEIVGEYPIFLLLTPLSNRIPSNPDFYKKYHTFSWHDDVILKHADGGPVEKSELKEAENFINRIKNEYPEAINHEWPDYINTDWVYKQLEEIKTPVENIEVLKEAINFAQDFIKNKH